MRHLAVSLLALLAATGTAQAGAVHAAKARHAPSAQTTRPSNVSLGLDEVHTLTFRAPIATIYVGNPTIADVTMVDARHAFVQGKGYGHTNIVALNQNGSQVFGGDVTVVGNQGVGTVILNRGAQRVTYSCTNNRCEPTPLPGDGKDSFTAGDQMMHYQDTLKKAAGG